MRKDMVGVKAGGDILEGEMAIPERAGQIVLFAHGSGSGWQSPRNQYVAECFRDNGYGTLLFDLLTPSEAREDTVTAAYRFNIDLLAGRMQQATDWVRGLEETAGMGIGYFGSSTGAAAALAAASRAGDVIKAVVSRGGRSDMAGEQLSRLKSPVLFIVGGNDPVIMDINRGSAGSISCENDIKVIEGASHLFEEPGALDKVAETAVGWYNTYLK
ncbi:MAG: hypothetical protein GF392_02505 [Candidatus Omnitrophica bacterium]|nr:hypothetical protein [Candidatus Omnitrophota bacterium]